MAKKKNGTRAVPAPKTWQMRFDLQDDLRWALREQVDRRRITVQAALVEAVEGWLGRCSTSGEEATQP